MPFGLKVGRESLFRLPLRPGEGMDRARGLGLVQ